MFYEYICEMYILADIKWNCREKKVYLERKTFEKNFKQNTLVFNVNDFISYKYICEIYILADKNQNFRKSRYT